MVSGYISIFLILFELKNLLFLFSEWYIRVGDLWLLKGEEIGVYLIIVFI